MSGRMMRPGRPSRPAVSPQAAGAPQSPPRPVPSQVRPASGRPDHIDGGLAGFFGEDQAPEAAMPAMPMPAVGSEQPVYSYSPSQAPQGYPQTPVQQWPQARAASRPQRAAATRPQPQAQNNVDGRPQQGLQLQSQQINRGQAAQTPPDKPMRPAPRRQQPAVDSALMDDPQYREFLAWKQAQQEATHPAAPATATTLQPATPARSPSSSTPLDNATPHTEDRSSRAVSGNWATVSAPTVHNQPTSQKIESEDGEFTPFHYPSYNGPGYPKGLGHGPIVTRKNIKTGKIIKVEGMAWEEFPESWRQMLDEKPYDDAGALRIFLKATSGIEAKYPFYEIGSAAHAGKFLDEMRSKRRMLHNGVDLSYGARPQQDAALWK